MQGSSEVRQHGSPRASVVIPTYRRTGPLRALLDSLLSEGTNLHDVEVVVSDDGSGDEVAAVVEAYASRFPRMKYVTGENAGPGVARNRGVAAASGDILLFVDSDCLVQPGWIEGLTGAIQAGAPFAFGPTRSAVPALEPFVHSIVFEDQLITATNLGFARRTFEDLGGISAEISRIAEDRDLFARARAAGIAPVRVAQAVVIHPPRLKKIRLPSFLGDAAHFRDLRAFYSAHPEVRAQDVKQNRVLLAKGAVKLLVGLTPLGLTTFVGHAFLKRREVNRRLAAAGVDFRVPVADAVKYGLLQPVSDLLRGATVSARLTAL